MPCRVLANPTQCELLRCAEHHAQTHLGSVLLAWLACALDSLTASAAEHVPAAHPSATCQQPDPNSRRRHGLPGTPPKRARHTIVLFQDALFVYGGELDSRTSTGLGARAAAGSAAAAAAALGLHWTSAGRACSHRAAGGPAKPRGMRTEPRRTEAVFHCGHPSSMQTQMPTRPGPCGALTSR